MKHLKLSSTNLLVIPRVRFSWLRVFKPELNANNGKMEYSVTLLLPKESTPESPNAAEIVAELREHFKSVAVDKFGAKLPPNLKPGIRDGDVDTNAEGEPKNPGYYFLNVSCEHAPVIVNGARQAAKESDGWKSGDWGSVQVAVYAYDTKGNKGVSAGLRGLQFITRGEPIGGGGTVNVDDFETHDVQPYDAFSESEYADVKDPNDPFA